MGKMPYFGKDYASDQARDFVKQQMKKNMASEAATERTRSQMARAAAAPEIAKQTLLAQGDAMVTNARRYTDAGYGVSGRGPTTGGTATESKSSEAFKKGLIEGGVTNPVALAAAMGHAEIESHFNVNAKGDPDKITGAPTAFGIFQWRHDRHTNLMKFAQSMGRNWLDPYVQGRYAAQEMVSGREFKGGNLLEAKTLDEANRAMLGYLRPKNWNLGLSVAAGGRERGASTDAWYKTLANVKPAGEEEAPGITTEAATGRTIIRHSPSTVSAFKRDFNDVDVGVFEPVPGGTPDKHGRIPYYWTPPNQVPGAKPGAPGAPVITTAKADPTAQPGAVPPVPPAPTAAPVTTAVPAAPAMPPVAPPIAMPPGAPAMPQPSIPGVNAPLVAPVALPGDDEPVDIDPYTGQRRV